MPYTLIKLNNIKLNFFTYLWKILYYYNLSLEGIINLFGFYFVDFYQRYNLSFYCLLINSNFEIQLVKV